MLDLARRPPASASKPIPTPQKRTANEVAGVGESANKRTRMSTRSSSARVAVKTAVATREDSAEPDEEEDEEYTPGTLHTPGRMPCYP